MKIKGNITYKDNIKLVYINLILTIICAFLLYRYYGERNFKDIAAIDSAHEVYHARLIRVPDREALNAQLKAHVRLAFQFLYSLSEYNYYENIERALHLWSYEGLNVVNDYQKEGLYDLLSTTPTRTECLIKSITIKGEKVTDNLQYPRILINETGTDISFSDQVKNNVRTYLIETVTYHRIIRGSSVVSEEIHTEELEIYTGFDINEETNPFGFKCQTITRDVQRITND